MYTEEELKQLELQDLRDKKFFVQDLSDSITKHISNIVNVDYDVFNVNGDINEYLVVTYSGGAIAVRNCRMNSLSAIFDELGRLLNGGYYDEVNSYRLLKDKAEVMEGLTK